MSKRRQDPLWRASKKSCSLCSQCLGRTSGKDLFFPNTGCFHRYCPSCVTTWTGVNSPLCESRRCSGAVVSTKPTLLALGEDVVGKISDYLLLKEMAFFSITSKEVSKNHQISLSLRKNTANLLSLTWEILKRTYRLALSKNRKGQNYVEAYIERRRAFPEEEMSSAEENAQVIWENALKFSR